MCSRASLSVQIVAMNAQNTSSPNPDIPIYPEWEHSDTVLSAFFWLYVDSTLFAAPLEKKFGVKWILFCAIFLNNAAYIVIPLFAATFGENGALFCRLLQDKIPVPYIAMATSIHVWATLVAHIGVAWCSNMVITESNRYLDKIMHFDIKSNGVYSALAPAIALMSGFIFGPLSDFLITKQYLQTVNARRIFHMTGASGIAVSVICLSFLNENQKPISILLMVTIYVSQAAMACGNVINMIDLSPRFAGIIFGFSNATGQAIALFAPISVEYIVTNDHEITQWRIIFLLTATIIFCTALFFVIFASGERQKWDGPEGPQIQRRSNLSIAEGPAIFVTVKYGN
ncbi:hypothetical protein ABEB36_009698 [Hypothenemus hampei]|uniref:Inorganic phosphate cotransporter n=1 Tax=Hypothenemus hampei TaxID=57062 RepID=A0ABD1EHJ8_HYPHA